MFCPNCGAPTPESARFCVRCGAALTFHDGGAQTAVATPPPYIPAARAASTPEYAGFWRRALAVSVDGLILGIPGSVLFVMFALPTISAAILSGDADTIGTMVLSSIFHWMWMGFLLFVMKVFYYALFESSKFQATPGKMVLSIIVTDTQGRPISLPRALARNAGKILSKAILYIGYIMVGFTPKQQALHDLIADTLVVMKD
jgi:uncharacterized RDD family membrane protein YckC